MLFTSNNNSNVIVYNSITNSLNDKKYDNVKPFSFLEYLNETKSFNNNIVQFSDYQNYLKKWNDITLTSTELSTIIRQEFIDFLKTITLNYTTAEEKKFLSNIDFNNNDDLEVATPFFVNKIKQVILYFAEKRDTYAIDLQLIQNKGSNFGVANFVKTTIIETLFGDDSDLPISSSLPLSAVSSELSVEVEEGYDTFNSYFDLDPYQPPEFYFAEGDRAKYFTSNTNPVDYNLFLNEDQSIINLINSERPVLQDLQSLVITVDTPDLNLLLDSDFIDYNTKTRNNLRLVLNAELIKNFTGTNFYYLSTNSEGQSLSGMLFKASSPYANLLNVYNPTTLTVPQSSTKYERDVGLFFKPTHQSILQLQTPFTYSLRPQVEKDKVYIFPDPSSYGNIVGLTKVDHESPLVYTPRGNLIQKNISSNNALGNSFVTDNDFTFESYHSKEQKATKGFLTNLYNSGIATSFTSDIYGNAVIGFKQQDSNYIGNYSNVLGNNVTMFGLSSTHTNIPYLSSIRQLLNFGTQVGTSSTLSATSPVDGTTSIYSTRHTPGSFVVFNIKNNTLNTLPIEFANVITKYPNQLQDLQTNLLNCETFGTTYSFTTSSFVIVDKVNYSNGAFTQSSNIPLILNSVVNNKSSNVYLKGNDLFIASLSSTNSPLMSSNNTRSFYLSLNSYNINNNRITSYSFSQPSDFTYDYHLNTLVSVTNINLVYNKQQDLFNAVITLKDFNNNIFIHSIFLRLSNSQVSLVAQKLFASSNINYTVNFYDSSYIRNISINGITYTPQINSSNGTITL